MFINIEKGKLVLYNLKIYKGLNDINYRLSHSGNYELIVKKEILPPHFMPVNKLFDGNKIIRYPHYEPTGKYIEYNDFYSDKEELYNISYYLYTVPNLYIILNKIIENSDFSELEKLNDYFKNKNILKNELEIFNEFKDKIYRNLVLEQIEYFSKNLKGKKVEIYNMDLEYLNHKVKIKKR